MASQSFLGVVGNFMPVALDLVPVSVNGARVLRVTPTAPGSTLFPASSGVIAVAGSSPPSYCWVNNGIMASTVNCTGLLSGSGTTQQLAADGPCQPWAAPPISPPPSPPRPPPNPPWAPNPPAAPPSPPRPPPRPPRPPAVPPNPPQSPYPPPPEPPPPAPVEPPPPAPEAPSADLGKRIKGGDEGSIVPIVFGSLIGAFALLLLLRFLASKVAEKAAAAKVHSKEVAMARQATLAKIRAKDGPSAAEAKAARREEKRRKREARQAAREAAEKERAEMEALAASSDEEGDGKV